MHEWKKKQWWSYFESIAFQTTITLFLEVKLQQSYSRDTSSLVYWNHLEQNVQTIDKITMNIIYKFIAK